LLSGLVLYSSITAFGQWSAATSGTTNNLNGIHLLDSAIGFAVGDAGTLLKTTDAGMTWSPLTSGTTNALHDVHFFDATQGVAVGEGGLIRRTTDGGGNWQTVTSGVDEFFGRLPLAAQTESAAATHKRFSTRRIQELHGRSAKADSSVAVSRPLKC
jgi:photosystem II stability/assembly factor-like uncharacterized protein